MNGAELDGLLILVGGFVGFGLFCALLLAPLLYKTRLVVDLSVVDHDGLALRGIPIEGDYNRSGPALQASGEGFIGARQLHGVRASLGNTDSEGRFRTTYYLRNIHTLFVGPQEIFLTPDLKAKMKKEPHVVRTAPNAKADPAGSWTDAFSGKR